MIVSTLICLIVSENSLPPTHELSEAEAISKLTKPFTLEKALLISRNLVVEKFRFLARTSKLSGEASIAMISAFLLLAAARREKNPTCAPRSIIKSEDLQNWTKIEEVKLSYPFRYHSLLRVGTCNSKLRPVGVNRVKDSMINSKYIFWFYKQLQTHELT